MQELFVLNLFEIPWELYPLTYAPKYIVVMGLHSYIYPHAYHHVS